MHINISITIKSGYGSDGINSEIPFINAEETEEMERNIETSDWRAGATSSIILLEHRDG